MLGVCVCVFTLLVYFRWIADTHACHLDLSMFRANKSKLCRNVLLHMYRWTILAILHWSNVFDELFEKLDKIVPCLWSLWINLNSLIYFLYLQPLFLTSCPYFNCMISPEFSFCFGLYWFEPHSLPSLPNALVSVMTPLLLFFQFFFLLPLLLC